MISANKMTKFLNNLLAKVLGHFSFDSVKIVMLN